MKNKTLLSFIVLVVVLLVGIVYFKNLPRPTSVSAPMEVELTEVTPEVLEQTVAKKEIEKAVVEELGITIYWVYNDTEVPCELEADDVYACYMVDTNSIYLSKELEGEKKDFVLYHEIGHSIYKENFPEEIFKDSLFGPGYETMANNFAWWIYSTKYPKEQEFAKSVLTGEKIKYFQETCTSDCIKVILKIEIK